MAKFGDVLTRDRGLVQRKVDWDVSIWTQRDEGLVMRSRWRLQSLGNPLLLDGYQALNTPRSFATRYPYAIQLRDL